MYVTGLIGGCNDFALADDSWIVLGLLTGRLQSNTRINPSRSRKYAECHSAHLPGILLCPLV